MEVIRDLSLNIESGDFTVFLGPSGCGKTTLLRMIAGLETLGAGSIAIDGQRVDDRPPGQRGVAMVFQNYALYPHMSVRENLAFGLRNIRVPSAEIAAKIDQAARILEIGALLDRRPSELSGGQRQRVAIGRAIVKQPKAFLFDEPLSNLDAALRARTRLELARLHQQLRATMIFVTHDQVEAMTMASRIVVMNAGRVEQAGSPLEIYRRPASRFVATFIGTPAMNILPAARAADSGGFLAVRLADGTTIDTRIPAGTLADGDGIEIGIRAEHIGRGGPVPAVVDVVEHLGDRTLAYARTPQDATLVFEEPGDSAIAVGDRIGLTMPAQAIQVFDRAGRAHHPA